MNAKICYIFIALSFNSTLVQLKIAAEVAVLRLILLFQFHIGSIKNRKDY